MARLIHQCPSCAGSLVLKEDTLNYFCESCGNYFDYDYFMDKDLISEGFERLHKCEFKSAEELFETMLSSDDANDVSVIGLFMAQYRFSDVSKFNLKRIIANRPCKDLSAFKNRVDEEHIPFFEAFEATSESALKIKENQKLESKINSDNKRYDMRINHINEEIPQHSVRFYSKHNYHDIEARPALIMTSIVMALIVIGTISSYIYGLRTDSESAGIFLSGGLALFVMDAIPFFISLAQFKEVRKLEKERSDLMRKTYTNKNELRRIYDETAETEKVISRNMVAAKAHFLNCFERFSKGQEDSDNDNE